MSWDKKHLPLYSQLSALIIVAARENRVVLVAKDLSRAGGGGGGNKMRGVRFSEYFHIPADSYPIIAFIISHAGTNGWSLNGFGTANYRSVALRIDSPTRTAAFRFEFTEKRVRESVTGVAQLRLLEPDGFGGR